MRDCRIICGDALEELKKLPSESVHCCVTSPPYWGLRDYGVEWQIGLEATPEAYTVRLLEVFAEVRRALRSDGTLWLNLGDSYATGAGKVGQCPGGGEQGARWAGRHPGRLKQNGLHTNSGAALGPVVQPNRMPLDGLKPKDLIGIPWRVAFALQADGWYLRSDIIWAKPNPMPESVTDRPTKAHEYLFLLAKSERYYYDHEAIFEPFVSEHASGNGFVRDARLSFQNGDGTARGNTKQWTPPSYNGSSFRRGKTAAPHANVGRGERQDHEGRNRRSVWTIATEPYPEAHFATFPPALIEPCVKAGCPHGGTVLDPFAGSGTTLEVARRLGCNSLGIELNPEYCKLIEKRMAQDALPLYPVSQQSTTDEVWTSRAPGTE